MSIQDCTVSTTTTFQVLDPVVTVPPGSTIAQYVETGLTQLTSGVATKVIAFLTTKISANYIFDEFVIENLVDDPQLSLTAQVTAQSTTGFTVMLNGYPDSTSYKLKWAVRILT